MTDVTDATMVKALSHPIRMQILAALETRTASPTQLAGEFGLPLANVSYHVTRLRHLGLIELTEEARRHGAIEHFYRLRVRPRISDEGWAAVPSIVKEALSQSLVDQIGREVAGAAAHGAFERADIHLSRLPLSVDEQGFRALARESERFTEKVREIEAAAAARAENDDSQDAIAARVVVMLFEAAQD